MTTRRPTMQNIAAALDISVNTVSRALNGKGGVGEATRERIQAEAERIGYVPNAHARSLVLGARMLIGLVITNTSNPFYASISSEVEKQAGDAGYSVILLSSDESVQREEKAARAVLRSGIDGVLVTPAQGRNSPWLRVQRAGVPVVMVNRQLEDMPADLVRTDNHAGMYAATQHAIENGARSLVLLDDDLPISTIRHRVEGYRAAKADAGLSITDTSITYVPTRRSDQVILPWHADDAYRFAHDLLDRGHRPDAFMAGNDYFALGVLRALYHRGIRVPDDAMVVGYGDYPFAEHLTPSLSTVRLPARTVARTAFDLLLKQIRGDEPSEPAEHVLAPELVVRESSRRAPLSQG